MKQIHVKILRVAIQRFTLDTWNGICNYCDSAWGNKEESDPSHTFNSVETEHVGLCTDWWFRHAKVVLVQMALGPDFLVAPQQHRVINSWYLHWCQPSHVLYFSTHRFSSWALYSWLITFPSCMCLLLSLQPCVFPYLSSLTLLAPL